MPPCQGGGREFEPRLPLHLESPGCFSPGGIVFVATLPSGKAGVCKTPIQRFDPARRLQLFNESLELP